MHLFRARGRRRQRSVEILRCPFSGHRHRYSQHLYFPPGTDVRSLFAFALSADSPSPGSKKFERASPLTLRVRSSRQWRTIGNFSPFFAHCSPIFPSGDLPHATLKSSSLRIRIFRDRTTKQTDQRWSRIGDWLLAPLSPPFASGKLERCCSRVTKSPASRRMNGLRSSRSFGTAWRTNKCN